MTGSRDWTDQQAIAEALADAVHSIPVDQETVLVSGACPRGADALAEQWARRYGLTIERHRAEDFGPWPACGPIRNKHMVQLGADLCIAFIGPCTSSRCHRPRPHPSHGASHCARLAEAAGIPVRRITT
ncbi:SLOG family protein [Streptomyces sp. NPDC091281]|uniref:SLOG family protein n=1 Tax=Streptomyces sp. NPDC091281 TaxID=3365985 RepID=UPI00382BF425